MVLDFGILSSNLFTESDASGDGLSSDIQSQIVWNDVGVGIVPIGAIVAWARNLTGAPPLLPNFVQCDGQVLSDGDSPFNGQTIPDLNGAGGDANERMLKGNSTSGGTGGSRAHFHTITRGATVQSGAGSSVNSVTSTASTADPNPAYYEVTWVIRIK